MTFIRQNLLTPVNYFEGRGQKIVGNRGKHFRTSCAIHGGDGETLSVLREDGGFNCFSCGAKGGDIVAYAMQADGVDFVTACRSLGAWVDDDQSPVHHQPTPFSARQALAMLAFEMTLGAIEIARAGHGHLPDEQTKDRLLQAAGRINLIQEAFQ